jgi:hypothetical protein
LSNAKRKIEFALGSGPRGHRSFSQRRHFVSNQKATAMQISHTSELPNGRGHYPIGRIRAAAKWRAASASGARADRLTAMRELIREAEEYGADAIVGLEFHIDDLKRAEIEAAALLRIAATGIAVKFIAAG